MRWRNFLLWESVQGVVRDSQSPLSTRADDPELNASTSRGKLLYWYMPQVLVSPGFHSDIGRILISHALQYRSEISEYFFVNFLLSQGKKRTDKEYRLMISLNVPKNKRKGKKERFVV